VPLSIVRSIQQSVRAAMDGRSCVVLAVSGGLDSMVLLDAAAALDDLTLVVATFDHGTGSAATEAAHLVASAAKERGLRLETSRAPAGSTTEAQWRDARWTFLRSVSQRLHAPVATAHTRDDQVETVLMRELRGAGPRGLAGLYAASPVIRPLLGHSRRQLAAYARARRLVWVEDPSNASPQYLRNRVRHDLLPALRLARPGIDADLLSISRRAARWRRDVERLVGSSIAHVVHDHGTGLDVRAEALEPYPVSSLMLLWPALAATVGLTLDRRGTERLAKFTRDGRVGARIQVSGGWQVVRSRTDFQFRQNERTALAPQPIDRSAGATWDGWSFRPTATASPDVWSAWLPIDRPVHVRAWSAGDTMVVRPGSPRRKVKHLLSNAGVTGHERARWPVVVAGDQIVWIPGVRRSDAATERSGRPGLAFSCEYQHR
jgi:tRNA(Ile)-lysidine synthase